MPTRITRDGWRTPAVFVLFIQSFIIPSNICLRAAFKRVHTYIRKARAVCQLTDATGQKEFTAQHILGFQAVVQCLFKPRFKKKKSQASVCFRFWFQGWQMVAKAGGRGDRQKHSWATG